MEDSEARESEQRALELVTVVSAAAAGVGFDLLIGSPGSVIVAATAAHALKSGIERVSGLRDHLPRLAPILGAVVAALSGRDLIANTALGSFDYGGPEQDRWIVTDYGRYCLAELDRRGREDAG